MYVSKSNYQESDIKIESLNEIEVEDSLRPYLPSFMVRRLYDLDSLNEFFIDRNFNEINKLAHKLKGNGAAYGHTKITDLAIQMRDSIEAKKYDSLRFLIDALGDYLKKFLK